MALACASSDEVVRCDFSEGSDNFSHIFGSMEMEDPLCGRLTSGLLIEIFAPEKRVRRGLLAGGSSSAP